MHYLIRSIGFSAALLVAAFTTPVIAQSGTYQTQGDPVYGQSQPKELQGNTYSSQEIVDVGHEFFGKISSNIALAIQEVFERHGQPNGYILGEEAGGAIVAGLRYGEGQLYTRNAGNLPVYWQGPSIGWDWGGDGARTMVLVYGLNSPNDIYKRFGGVSGSAFLIGGVGVTALTNAQQTVVPIRSGVGGRIGANVGYLKFRPRATWNPF